MKLPNIQQRYIRRYALAVVLATRLSSSANDLFRLPGESDTEHRLSGWISGGFKDHWPSAIKNRLRRLNRRANKYRLQASLMRPRYQRTKKLHKLCKEAIEQARIDIAQHLPSCSIKGRNNVFDLPMYLDNLDDGEFTLWVAALLADDSDNQG